MAPDAVIDGIVVNHKMDLKQSKQIFAMTSK
jgi:hypothetical protein